jgi:hypothetical protein
MHIDQGLCSAVIIGPSILMHCDFKLAGPNFTHNLNHNQIIDTSGKISIYIIHYASMVLTCNEVLINFYY